MGFKVVAVTLALATVAQSISYPYIYQMGYGTYGGYPTVPQQQAYQQPTQQQGKYDYKPTQYVAQIGPTRYINQNGIQTSATQLTTPAYLGDSMASLFTAIRDFLLATPFIEEADLLAVPFLPQRKNPTPLPKVTRASFKAAIDKLSSAIIDFVNNPDLMDPNNYLDPTVKGYVTTFGQQFAAFINGMKSYYSTKPNGPRIGAAIDRIFGGFLKENPSSGFFNGGAQNPKSITNVPWDPAMRPLSPQEFAVVMERLPEFLAAIEPIFEAFNLYDIPWEQIEAQGNIDFSSIPYTFSLESFPDQIAAITRIVMNFIKALQGVNKSY